jgi:hypothetical protein
VLEFSCESSRKFTVLIEQDEQGYTLPVCLLCGDATHTPVEVCLENERDDSTSLELVGIQQISL